MSQQRGLPHARPYDGRAPLDPDLVLIAASGLVPQGLAHVARRLGLSVPELLARHGYVLIEEMNAARLAGSEKVEALRLKSERWRSCSRSLRESAEACS